MAPADPQQQARALLGVGRHAQAETTLRTALAEAPDDAELLALLAFTLRRLGDPAGALETCRAALAADPELAEAHIEHAETLLAVMRHDEAVTAAEQAVRLEPQWSDSHQMLAHALALSDRHDEARAAADRALTLAPQSVPALVMVANVARYDRRFDDAERAVRAALALDPEDVDARSLLAMVDAERLRTRRSLRMLLGVARDHPADANPMAMTWPVRHLLDTLKRWPARAVIVTFVVAVIGLWWAPVVVPAQWSAGLIVVSTLGYAALLLVPAGRTPWRCLGLMPPLMRRAAGAGLVTAGVQVALLCGYALTAQWWLTLSAVALVPVLWLLEAGVTVGAGLTDPGGRLLIQEQVDGFRQWWADTRRELGDAWRDGGHSKP